MLTVRDIVGSLADGTVSLDTVLCNTYGEPFMYFVSRELNKIDLEAKTDFDVGNELKERIEWAVENDEDEVDFLSHCLEDGYTLEDFGEVSGEQYKWAKKIAEEHGLI